MNPILQQAVSAVRSGRHKEAQLLLTQILKEDPGESQAWFLLSQLVDSEQKRLTYLKKTIALDPDHKLATQQLAQLETAQPITVTEDDVEAERMATSETVVEEEIELAEAVQVEEPAEERTAELEEAGEVSIDSAPETPKPFDTLTEMLEPVGEQAVVESSTARLPEEPTKAQLAPVAEPPPVEQESQNAQQTFLTRTLYVLIGLAIIIAIALLYTVLTSF